MAGSPKITILSEQHRGKTFELTKDLYTVGRIEERDICIPDPTISTYHGSFVKSGNTYILKDNNSTNGSRVNNEPIVEQELKKPHLPVSGAGSLGLLETELYKRIDVIERVGGELKKRWQHCLADVTVRLMQHTEKETTTDDTEKKDEHKLHE